MKKYNLFCSFDVLYTEVIEGIEGNKREQIYPKTKSQQTRFCLL